MRKLCMAGTVAFTSILLARYFFVSLKNMGNISSIANIHEKLADGTGSQQFINTKDGAKVT